MSSNSKKRARVERQPKKPRKVKEAEVEVSESEELDDCVDYDDLDKTEADALPLTGEERTAFIRKVLVEELFSERHWTVGADGKGGYRDYLIGPLFEEDNLICLIGDTPCDVTQDEFADELKNLVQLGMAAATARKDQ